MRKEAWSISIVTIFLCAAALLYRYWQNLYGFEADTGLAIEGSFYNIGVIGVCIGAAVILMVIVIMSLKKLVPDPDNTGAQSSRGIVFRALGIIFSLAASGSAVFLAMDPDLNFAALDGIFAVFTVIAGFSYMYFAIAPKRSTSGGRAINCVIIVVYACYWLLLTYKKQSANPNLWEYAIEVLAVACITLAVYYLAGYTFGKPRPRRIGIFCNLAAVLCCMTIADEHGLGLTILFFSHAALLMMFSWATVWNLIPESAVRRADEIPEGEETAPEQ